jgi:hypothetical protein
LHDEISRPFHQPCYWSASQTEFATDVRFRDAAALAGWYRACLQHGISTFKNSEEPVFLASPASVDEAACQKNQSHVFWKKNCRRHARLQRSEDGYDDRGGSVATGHRG